MFNKIKIVSLLILLSTFSIADSNSTMKNDNLDVNLSTMSKEEFAKSDYIRVRFIGINPLMKRIVCNQLCKKECMETIELNTEFSFLKLFVKVSKSKSKSIGMTKTLTSKKIIEEDSSFFDALKSFEEYQILKPGEFYMFIDYMNRQVSFNVELLAGHEYEIDMVTPSVLLINPDGSTTMVESSYPSKCGFFDSKDKIFPVLRN